MLCTAFGAGAVNCADISTDFEMDLSLPLRCTSSLSCSAMDCSLVGDSSRVPPLLACLHPQRSAKPIGPQTLVLTPHDDEDE